MIIKFWKKIWIANELQFCALALSLVKCWDIPLSETYKKKFNFSVTISEKKILPRKMSISFEGKLLLTQESHGPQIGPISKGCLNSSRCDQPRACSSIRQDAPSKFKAHGACQWKWAPWCYGGSPFNNPLTKSGEGKDATKLYLGTNHRFYHPIGWPTSLLMQQRRTNRGKFAVQDNIFEHFNFKQGSDIA